jgi:hypothetical protein
MTLNKLKVASSIKKLTSFQKRESGTDFKGTGIAFTANEDIDFLSEVLAILGGDETGVLLGCFDKLVCFQNLTMVNFGVYNGGSQPDSLGLIES